MSVCRKWVEQNAAAVIKRYRDPDMPSSADLANEFNTRQQNIWACCQQMPKEEYETLKIFRYSLSKRGDKNPMTGKFGEKHHRYKGIISDGKGYLMTTFEGVNMFLHHAVICEALGLKKLPAQFLVHHVDGDPLNNALDNLALTTRAGHNAIHYLQKKDGKDLTWRKTKIGDAIKFMMQNKE